MAVRLEEIAANIVSNIPTTSVSEALEELKLLSALNADEQVESFINMIRQGLSSEQDGVSSFD